VPKQPAVYVLASDRNGTLYTGVTSNLVGRTWQHREHAVDGFTKRYDLINLVWYELLPTMESAIIREKQIKKWNRAWKLRLIQVENPLWTDLWPSISRGSIAMDNSLRSPCGSSLRDDLRASHLSRLRGNDEQKHES
jgi:putative endonuclease